MEWSLRAQRALVFVAVSTSVVPASAGVTEAEAIRIFLERSPQARRGPLVARAVRAGLGAETRIPNPVVAFQVEEAAGVRDEFLTFEQELPVSGRRGLLDERAEVAASAAALDAAGELQAAVYELQLSFHEVLYRERLVATLRRGGEHLERTVEILERREREGDRSGYDVLRAEQELAEIRIDTVEAEAVVSAARARFGSFFDPGAGMESAALEGDLNPTSAVPQPEEAAEAALLQRLDLRSMTAERERLDLERKAAHRRRLPEPVLTAGWKRTAALGLSDAGYVAALAVPLPVFDRGRLDQARATAEGERVELDAEILARRIRADVRAAVAHEQAARTAAERYGEDYERRAGELSRIARLRYDEGEAGILELLDAHRAARTMQLRALAAQYRARLAEIDRNRLIGNEVRP